MINQSSLKTLRAARSNARRARNARRAQDGTRWNMPLGSNSHRRQNYYYESRQFHHPRTLLTRIQHFHMLSPAIQTAKKNSHPFDFPVIEKSGSQLELPLRYNGLMASGRCLRSSRTAVLQDWSCWQLGASHSNETGQIFHYGHFSVASWTSHFFFFALHFAALQRASCAFCRPEGQLDA